MVHSCFRWCVPPRHLVQPLGESEDAVPHVWRKSSHGRGHPTDRGPTAKDAFERGLFNAKEFAHECHQDRNGQGRTPGTAVPGLRNHRFGDGKRQVGLFQRCRFASLLHPSCRIIEAQKQERNPAIYQRKLWRWGGHAGLLGAGAICLCVFGTADEGANHTGWGRLYTHRTRRMGRR